MTNLLKKYEERLELIEIAVKEGAKTKKEICEKTGYSPYVVNSTLKVFPRQAQEIQNEMKKATQKSNKSKGRKTSQNSKKVAKQKETTRKENTKKSDATNSQEKIAVLDISMLNVENVIEILQQYMEEGVKIAVSNTTIYQINSNSERRNETTGEKTARAKRASELMNFLQKRKEELKPIWITGDPSREALLLACKELKGDVVVFTGSQLMDLTAWTFGVKSKYFPKEVTTFDNGLTTPMEIPTDVMQREEFDSDFNEKQTATMEIPSSDRWKDIIKTLPETRLDDNGDLYLYNEFALLQVKTYRGEEKDVSTKVKLEKGDLVFIAIGVDERLVLEYYKIIETSLRNHAKRLYKKTIYSFETSTTINNSEFKRFADKAIKKVFGR